MLTKLNFKKEAVLTEKNALNQADTGDLEKLLAVTTVMTQSVIAMLMQTNLPVGQQFFLGGIYETIKFSASAFIFGILFSVMRTHPNVNWRDYPGFMVNRWHVLFIPSIIWTLVYLLVTPQLQQHLHYHNWQGFCWQFINGNAAPHLWYNVMMLQFIVLVPFFWWLARLVQHHLKRGIIAFLLALLFEVGWHLVYETEVFHGPQKQDWYLMDRLFPSFLIFGVSGVLLCVFYQQLVPFLMRHWLSQIVIWLGLLYIVTINFFSYGTPVRLSNAPYYLPSMIFYNLSTICLIATLMSYLQHFRNQWLPLIHWVAIYAHRSYLGHVFWLYWSYRAVNHLAPQLALAIKLPLLVILTIGLSFAFSYIAHRAWDGFKNKLGWRRVRNG